MIFRFDGFTLSWDPETGEAVTEYRDGTRSGCGVVQDDYYHAERLGISAQEHRLQHELAHHIVGFLLYNFHGSPVVWRDAQGIDQDEGGHYKDGWSEAAREEWICNLIQYRVFGQDYDESAEIHAIESGMDVEKACDLLYSLMAFAQSSAVSGFPHDMHVEI